MKLTIALLYLQIFCFILISDNRKECLQLATSFGRMSRGVDITKLDLFSFRFGKKDGFGEVLFNFTCKQNRTWTHPIIENYQYNLPDQIISIGTLPSGAQTYKASFHSNMKEFKESLANNVALEGNYGLFGSFSSSCKYADARKQILKSKKTICEVCCFCEDLKREKKNAKLDSQFRHQNMLLLCRWTCKKTRKFNLAKVFWTTSTTDYRTDMRTILRCTMNLLKNLELTTLSKQTLVVFSTRSQSLTTATCTKRTASKCPQM